jgi:Tfp pilus assembly protein PilF
VAAAGQHDVDAFVGAELLGPLDRVRIACFAALFYLAKTLWPDALWAHYALPRDLDLGTLGFTAAVVVVLFASALFVRLRRRLPGTALAWCAYLVLLAPVSGLVLAGRQLAADRYAYLPGMVLGVGLGACAFDLHGRLRARSAWVVPLVALAVLGGWTWRTVEQIGTWRDSETLLRHALAHEPTSVPAHNNLATLLLERGDGAAALPHLEEAALGAPREPTVVFNLAGGYDAVGRPSDAVAAAERAAELDPALWQAWMFVGTRAVETDPERAVAALRRAVALEPAFVPIRNALVRALTAAGRTDEAAHEVEQALGVPGARPAQLARLAELADALGREDLARRARERAAAAGSAEQGGA